MTKQGLPPRRGGPACIAMATVASQIAYIKDWHEATLAGDSSSGGTQRSTDSSLQGGPKAGPVRDDSLIACHLCLDALKHLSHKWCQMGPACMASEAVFNTSHTMHVRHAGICGNIYNTLKLAGSKQPVNNSTDMDISIGMLT